MTNLLMYLLSFSNPVLNRGGAILEFASIYEAKQALTIIQKQRFVEWWSGDDLDLIWTKNDQTGTGTYVMVDAINEGFSVKCGTGTGDNSSISFNGIDHYSPTGSRQIWIWKRLDTNQWALAGLSGSAVGFASIFSALGVQNRTSETNYRMFHNNDTSPASTTDTTVLIDTVFHLHDIEALSSSCTLKIDNTLEATATVDIPISKMSPFFQTLALSSAGGKEARVRYFEVYNT